MNTTSFDASSLDAPVDCVLGGGGVKGLAHVGFLQALTERKVRIADVYGASIGTVIAAFFTNGHPLDTLEETFMAELKHFGKDAFAKAIKRPRLQRLGLIDLRPIFQPMVKRHNLKPQPNLKIVACYRDGLRLRPFVFQGTDYDLVTALSASCALPPFLRAEQQEIEGHNKWLLDGGLFHPEPYHFSLDRPAIISKLGMAKHLPANRLSALDWVFNLVEMSGRPIKEAIDSKPGPRHLVIPSGDGRVATMTFDIPDQRLHELVTLGYQSTAQSLDALTARAALNSKREPVAPGKKK